MDNSPTKPQLITTRRTVLIAGAACEMHPSALLKGIELRATAVSLAEATDRARGQGVTQLPAVK